MKKIPKRPDQEPYMTADACADLGCIVCLEHLGLRSDASIHHLLCVRMAPEEMENE